MGEKKLAGLGGSFLMPQDGICDGFTIKKLPSCGMFVLQCAVYLERLFNLGSAHFFPLNVSFLGFFLVIGHPICPFFLRSDKVLLRLQGVAIPNIPV